MGFKQFIKKDTISLTMTAEGISIVANEFFADSFYDLPYIEEAASVRTIVNTSTSDVRQEMNASKLAQTVKEVIEKNYADAYKVGGHADPKAIMRIRTITTGSTAEKEKGLPSGGKIIEYIIYTPSREDIDTINANKAAGKGVESKLKPYQMRVKVGKNTYDWRIINLRTLLGAVLKGKLLVPAGITSAEEKILSYAEHTSLALKYSRDILRNIMTEFGFTGGELPEDKPQEDIKQSIIDKITNDNSEATKITRDYFAKENERLQSGLKPSDVNLYKIEVQSFRHEKANITFAVNLEKLVQKKYGLTSLAVGTIPSGYDKDTWRAKVAEVKKDMEDIISKHIGTGTYKIDSKWVNLSFMK